MKRCFYIDVPLHSIINFICRSLFCLYGLFESDVINPANPQTKRIILNQIVYLVHTLLGSLFIDFDSSKYPNHGLFNGSLTLEQFSQFINALTLRGTVDLERLCFLLQDQDNSFSYSFNQPLQPLTASYETQNYLSFGYIFDGVFFYFHSSSEEVDLKLQF